MLIQCDQLAQCFRRQFLSQNRVRRPVPFKYSVRHQPIRRSLRFDLLRSLTERQRLGLSKHVCQKQIMMSSKRVKGLSERDEVARNKTRPLMDQLVERVLTVCSGLSPVNRSGRMSDCRSIYGDMLAVALHRQLLQIGRETLQILFIRQYGDSLSIEEIVVPHSKKTHKRRQVSLERRVAEVFVHLMEAIKHGSEVVRPNGNHRGEAYGGIHGVTAADPVPELEHVGGIDTEPRHFLRVR